ncbi:DUF899 domain-containing protein [Granulicella arctica]|uniref:Putative dithiol-disulfide oxidoreductase (DUF899 family) n=1 Tax=Granulicella arctica TaxID=940613 RepID=A0A7Y9PF80_9BACT|nr:thioredoxin family protein [Granulicella arctica]NYF78584.1 putative dithiol-disulfide oxidoreductase (DUF899 family) [Granulicella arctica]
MGQLEQVEQVDGHSIVSQEEWLVARKALLLKEKEATHLRDAIREARLALPWVKVEKEYVFETPEGKKTLAELFDGRSQLVIYHFMLGPGWAAGCPGCSFMSDHLDGTLPHLNNHDVTMMVISRAPLVEIETYKKRMGWRFPWVSAFGSAFNYDYDVSVTKEQVVRGEATYNFETMPADVSDTEMHGLSSFYKNEAGGVFHTYSSYARGHEDLLGTMMILDRAPKGRNEKGTMDFVKRHDEYADAPKQHACCSK